jgi:hypothetical protein
LHSSASVLLNREFDATSSPRDESPMKLAKYAKFRQEKFGGVLFETRSEKVYALNPTAAAIVREIGAGCDEPSLVGRMNGRFSDSGGSIEREVLAFTANLRKHGLIEE